MSQGRLNNINRMQLCLIEKPFAISITSFSVVESRTIELGKLPESDVN